MRTAIETALWGVTVAIVTIAASLAYGAVSIFAVVNPGSHEDS